MGLVTSIVGSLITFVIGLVVGGLGIYVGDRLVVGDEGLEYALWTALYGAVGWALGALLFGWVPLVGGLIAPLAALVIYLVVVNLRYSGGWREAIGITAVAWFASALVLFLLDPLVRGVDAIGVPFL